MPKFDTYLDSDDSGGSSPLAALDDGEAAPEPDRSNADTSVAPEQVNAAEHSRNPSRTLRIQTGRRRRTENEEEEEEAPPPYSPFPEGLDSSSAMVDPSHFARRNTFAGLGRRDEGAGLHSAGRSPPATAPLSPYVESSFDMRTAPGAAAPAERRLSVSPQPPQPSASIPPRAPAFTRSTSGLDRLRPSISSVLSPTMPGSAVEARGVPWVQSISTSQTDTVDLYGDAAQPVQVTIAPEEQAMNGLESPRIFTLTPISAQDRPSSMRPTDTDLVQVWFAEPRSALSAVSPFSRTEEAALRDVSTAPAPRDPAYLRKLVRLNIAMHAVGCQEDVQPFVALGRTLRSLGHRIRLATHPIFRPLVEKHGLEFFSIGGSPASLMAQTMKTTTSTRSATEAAKAEMRSSQDAMSSILDACWRSCFEAGDGMHRPSFATVEEMKPDSHFLANVIIANPPSSAHLHCAEKLGIPLHILFTVPWSPTSTFPHPLSNMASARTNGARENFTSYETVDAMAWEGLGNMINEFRQNTLYLEPLDSADGADMLSRLRIPYTYCWSPALLPKPEDWGEHITVSGFCHLHSATDYTPDLEVSEFLAAGPEPIYVELGSFAIDDPDVLVSLIFAVVERTGQRAVVSQAFHLLDDSVEVPPDVLMIDHVPHDWLFKRVSCVVHHGSPGLTSLAIIHGKPIIVVPHVADQPFWADIIAKSGVGPQPVPFEELSEERLAEAIRKALKPDIWHSAADMAFQVAHERGLDTTAEAFHRGLEIRDMRCSLAPRHVAVWRLRQSDLKLSAFAAQVLVEEGLIDTSDLEMHRLREYETRPKFRGSVGGRSLHPNPKRKVAAQHKTFKIETVTAKRGTPNKGKERVMPIRKGDASKGKMPAGTTFGLGFLKQISSNGQISERVLEKMAETQPMQSNMTNTRSAYGTKPSKSEEHEQTQTTSDIEGYPSAATELGVLADDEVTDLESRIPRESGIGNAAETPNRRANKDTVASTPSLAAEDALRNLRKSVDTRLQCQILAIRHAEGMEAYNSSSLEERFMVVQRWHSPTIEKRRPKPANRTDLAQTGHDSRKAQQRESNAGNRSSRGTSTSQFKASSELAEMLPKTPEESPNNIIEEWRKRASGTTTITTHGCFTNGRNHD